MVSTKGRYALRVMIDLAQHSNGHYIALKDISKRQGISVKYLEQIMALLTRSGILQSLRGNNGGYRLSVNPKEISAGEILRAAEGTMAPIACLSGNTNLCANRGACTTLPFWQELDHVINTYVDGVTLSELARQADEVAHRRETAE